MRPRRRVGRLSRTEQVALGSRELQALKPPPGISPLRLRLLRLCLDGSNMPCPDRLAALRGMSLREALELEEVAHHRQREALILQDELGKAPPAGAGR